MAPSLEGANLEDKSTSIERLSRYSQAEMRSHAVPKQKLVDKTNVDCSKKILNVEPTSETGSINEDKTRVDDDRLMKPCFNNIPGPKKAAKYSYDEDFKTSTESLERVWKGSGILNPDEFNNAVLLIFLLNTRISLTFLRSFFHNRLSRERCRNQMSE